MGPKFTDEKLAKKVKDLKESNLDPESNNSRQVEDLRTIAGRTAHIMNDLLMGIQGNISLMALDIDHDHPHHKMLQDIEKHIEKGAVFTDHLLEFAGIEQEELKLEDLNKLIKQFFTRFSPDQSKEGRDQDGRQTPADGIMINPADIINVYEELVISSKTVLLVDDEKMITEVGQNMLERMDLKVFTANSGAEAINVYKNNKEKIDMVIMDLKMPDMDGGETYDRLKQVDPDVKVLLASGYGTKKQVDRILKRGCNGFIKKPFNIKDLCKKVKDVLEN